MLVSKINVQQHKYSEGENTTYRLSAESAFPQNWKSLEGKDKNGKDFWP